MAINYQVNPIISVHDLIDILKKSTLGLRRPLADLEAMESINKSKEVKSVKTGNRWEADEDKEFNFNRQ
jgi:hypothetical protein